MSTGTIELVYFDIAARAEHIRLALHHAGIDFKDTRVQFGDWKALKPTIPGIHSPLPPADNTKHVISYLLFTFMTLNHPSRRFSAYPESG